MLRILAILVFFGGGISSAAIPPIVLLSDVRTAQIHGNPNLFGVRDNAIEVTWDSIQTNSFLYFPLGMTLTRADHFQISFDLTVSAIEIGTSANKPYTFQIAVGLFNTTNAFDPEMFRGSGVNVAHGPRNLVEWNYFPDSGFGATIAPTVATEANQIAFSDNHPIELIPGQHFTFELEFSSDDQTLRSRMRQGTNAAVSLKDLAVSSAFAEFRLNAFGVSSYSDAGQVAPFAGSIQAEGTVKNLQVVVFERPRLGIETTASGLRIVAPTSIGWRYFVEGSDDLITWTATGGPVNGDEDTIRAPVDRITARRRFFRMRGERVL